MTNKQQLAPIDRRVEVISGMDGKQSGVRRVSDLRRHPFVVLLGEPGMGKSSVFEQEAQHEGVHAVKVRDIMNGAQLVDGKPAFLDALDEYRSDGQPSDKISQLASLLQRSGIDRWRLSCRSEADTEPMRRRAATSVIVVAQLMPLDDWEASAILTSLGEEEPARFVDKAHGLGASGFIENPLSLRLLWGAVRSGDRWPETRFDLFDEGSTRLAHEINPEYRLASRSAPSAILDAAGHMALILLTSGAKGIWRSNAAPPRTTGSERGYATIHDISLPKALIDDTLNTALFRGEGEVFEPIHKTIAEFLGARALANAISEKPDAIAYPLSRTLALITARDGRPPTEHRGLFAWFAAHLAKRGLSAAVTRLIKIDPVTPLIYGDVGVLDLVNRRTVLKNIGEGDPFFRTSDVGITAVAGLAADDLAPELERVLLRGSDDTHRLLTVLDALTTGRPVQSLRPTLRALALNQKVQEWIRSRSIEAWLNGAPDAVLARRELLDELESEPPSLPRENLRADLISLMPRSALKLYDIRSVIAGMETIPEDNMLGRFYGVRRALVNEPWPELFDEPWAGWLSTHPDHRNAIEVGDLVDSALAAAIRGEAHLTADRLFLWNRNVNGASYFNVGSATKGAINEWLKADTQNELALFLELLKRDSPEEGAWVVGQNYLRLSGRPVSSAVVRDMLARIESTPEAATRDRYVDIVKELVRVGGVDPPAYWMVFHFLEMVGDQTRLKEIMICEIEPWRLKQWQQSIAVSDRDVQTRENNLLALTRQLEDLESGRHVDNLNWGAELYFQTANKGGVSLSGIAHVKYYSNDETTSAILKGWRHLATHDWPGIDVEKMGRLEAQGKHFRVEYPAIAGIDRMIEEGETVDVAAVPMTLVISILRHGFVVGSSSRRDELDRIAIAKLASAPIEGADALARHWKAALDGGSTHLVGVERLRQPDGDLPAVRDAVAVTLTHM